ncbi:HSP90 family protein [Parenemella sanctibonifatiensis]|uniref:HSP90 family protein n=1 Tax=Parenemella sanctibonifatiensis TaxID=2016505 RepID=A0A255DXL7_9ACTN|nr:HSP90 family protein [Parenemella sanctibonifatiensis]
MGAVHGRSTTYPPGVFPRRALRASIGCRDDGVVKENFQVNLRGVVEILSHHLYSSPHVYVRELIQNARDAVVARIALGDTGTWQGRIELVVDDVNQALVVRDNGIGLTEEESRSLLATIGASSKREQLVSARREFLGQFGIGLLSCFLVADRIEVRSRSARTPEAETMLWVGYGDGTFSVGPAPEPLSEPGSEVRVHARHGESSWVSYDRVRLLAEQFASLLPGPIMLHHLAREGAPEHPPLLVSTRTPPWQLPPEEVFAWCEEKFGTGTILGFPVQVPAAGVRGLAFIGNRTGGSHRSGDMVYSHGMFVSDQNTQLAPTWATFVNLAIEAGDLPLTASRESLQEGDSVTAVREEIGQQIRDGIERAAMERPHAFADFMAAHHQSLLAMALGDDDMLDFVARNYLWETSQGNKRAIDLATKSFYTATHEQFQTYAPLLAAQGKTLINGGYTHGVAILHRLRKQRGKVLLEEFEPAKLLGDLPEPPADRAALADVVRSAATQELADDDIAVEVRDFAPASVMSLHLGGGTGFVSTEDADPWAEFFTAEQPDRRAKLILNLRSEAVAAIGADLAAGVRAPAVRALYVLALLAGGERLKPTQQADLASALTTLLLSAGGTTNQDQHRDQ